MILIFRIKLHTLIYFGIMDQGELLLRIDGLDLLKQYVTSVKLDCML